MNFLTSKVRRIFYPPGTTPVNWKILANVFLSMVGAIFTSWYDVSHAVGFRVWGRNSIKNHSLTLLDINLCIKPGLNKFLSPSPTSLPV